jgi:metallophosphoesterase (TIGR03768 family)
MKRTLETKISLVFLGISVLTIIISCQKYSSYTNDFITSNSLTTLDRTIVPDNVSQIPAVRIDDPANFEKFGYGKWHYGPGLPIQKRLDLMPSDYSHASVTKSAALLRFFTMTDVHMTDKESPAQGIYFNSMAGNFGISVYSPLMLYSTHVLNAAVQKINSLNRQDPLDFGLALGDLANNAQYNELRWFIDVIDGKKINPDSGKKDDPIAGPNNDYQDEYIATGLDKSIPWYALIGNHDHFWMGSKPLNDRVKATLKSGNIFQVGNIFTDPGAMDKTTFSTGTMDGSTLYGTIIGSGIVSQMGTIPTIAADSNRRALSKTEWMSEFSKTSSSPVGHGFGQTNPENRYLGCYSFEPKSSLPIKVIVLDDTEDETDAPGPSGFYGYGSLANGRMAWLVNQLKAGQNEEKLMIIAAHIPVGVASNTPVGWYNYTDEKAVIAELKKYPNLILWVSGHRHLNTVTAFKSDDTSHPEYGFWEVETKSLREFPQQFRTFDIVRNSNNTISIFTVNVDPDVPDGSFPAISRSYAIASNQIYNISEAPQPTGSVSYNAELIKQLSPSMQAKIQNYK